MTTRHRTYCRLCEVGCGLVVEIADDGRTIEKVRPDHDHPVTAGFACNKGLLTEVIHHDPDRLDRPQRRVGDRFVEATWDEAFDDISARVAAIVAEHGPSAVAGYIGNPAAFNATAGPALALYLAMAGSTTLFTTGTQDCANKFAIGELLWGSAQRHLVPDVDHCDLLVLFGTNPRVSKGSFASMPDPVGRLAAVEARGGRVVFVDPRRIESTIGEVVQIVPDTDAFLLAALLCEIDQTRGFDAEGAARVRSLDALRAFVARFSPETVAPVVGIEAEAISALALAIADAPSAALHLSTGVNMGRNGALAYWLLQLLSLLTGNLDRRGGNIGVTRGTAPAPMARGTGPESFESTPWGEYRPNAAGLPGAVMADMIRAGEVRALFVTAGNPALTMAGGDGLADALSSLDLLVTIDLYRNATGELADWVLPACDWYEREDLNVFVQGTQMVPYVQWAGPIVAPVGGRRTEHAIFAELGARGGHPVMFGVDDDMLALINDAALAEHGLSVDALRATEGNVAVLPPTTPGGFLDAHTSDGTIDGDPPMLAPAFARALDTFAEMAAAPPDTLRLITRRTSHTINSALQNVERLKARGAADNPLYMARTDAERLGLVDGDAVRITNRWGAVESTVRIDDTLRRGVVAMTHGFGNAATTGMPAAQRHPGVNVNALAPTGPGTFDPVGTMTQLTGIPVEVHALATR
ncbi:MAG: molybdopterin-dependent oxidoreductase [Acidimicrobiia bacterium]